MKHTKYILPLLTVVALVSGCNTIGKQEQRVDDLKQVLKDVYTPKSMDEFKEHKQQWIDKGVLTENEAEALFQSATDELTEADKGRTLTINKAKYTIKDWNSSELETYVYDCTLKYADTNTNFIVQFMTDSETGKVNSHSMVVVNN